MLKKIIVCALISFSALQVKAGHLLGGAIYWENVAQDTFVFYMDVYLDCSNTPPFRTINGPTGSITLNLYSSSKTHASCSGPCDPMTIYKSDSIVLTGNPPANGWMFSASLGFFPNNTNVPNETMFLSSTMFANNSGQVPQHSAMVTSPQSLIISVPAINNSYLGNAVGASADSVVTDLIPVKSGANTNATYKAGFSGSAPLPDGSENALNGPNQYNRGSATLTSDVNFTQSLEWAYYIGIEHTFYRSGLAYAKTYSAVPVFLIPTPSPQNTLSVTDTFTGSLSLPQPVGQSLTYRAQVGDTLDFIFVASQPGDSIYFTFNSNLLDSSRAVARGWANFNHLEIANLNPNQREPNLGLSIYQLRFVPNFGNYNQSINTINVTVKTNPCVGGQTVTTPIKIILQQPFSLPVGNIGSDTLELCNTTDSIEISAANSNFHWQPSNLVNDSTATKVAFTGQNPSWLYLIDNQTGLRDSIFIIPHNSAIVLGITRNQNTLTLTATIVLDSIVWKLNGITHVINQNQINLTTPGLYSVIGFTKNCTFYSDTFVINSLNVGLLENTIAQFSVFPNPAKNHLNISFKKAAKTTFIIYSLEGKTLLKKELNPKNNSINISSLSAGTYLIKSDLGVQKFVKE